MEVVTGIGYRDIRIYCASVVRKVRVSAMISSVVILLLDFCEELRITSFTGRRRFRTLVVVSRSFCSGG